MSESDALTHYLRFADQHVEPIQAGEKYVTARYDFSRPIKPGDTIECRDPAGDVFATVTVDSITKTTVARFAQSEYDGHEGYETVMECAQDLESYYAGECFRPNTKLTVIAWSPASVEVVA